MQIAIEISDDFYNKTIECGRLCYEYMGTVELADAIKKGTVLPDKHGRLKKVLIEIPEEEIYLYMSYGGTNGQRLMGYIANGKFLPDNPTNGEVICLLYPNLRYVIQNDRVITTIGVASSFDLDWWNAPYKEDGEQNETD